MLTSKSKAKCLTKPLFGNDYSNIRYTNRRQHIVMKPRIKYLGIPLEKLCSLLYLRDIPSVNTTAKTGTTKLIMKGAEEKN